MCQEITRLELEDREILQKLIEHYEIAIKHISVHCYNHSDCISTAEEFHIQFGICFCAEMTYRTSIESRWWVKRNRLSSSPYWYATPDSLNSKGEIINALNYRVDRMKYILKNL